MKRLLPILAGVGLLGAMAWGCTGGKSFLEVQGAVVPSDGCAFKPGASTDFRPEAAIEVNYQRALLNDNLSKIIGLQIQNEIELPELQDHNGTSLSGTNQGDVYLTSVDVVATDENGGSLASETLQVNALVPQKDKNVAVFDLMGRKLADALKQRSTPFTATLALTFHGKMVSGTDVSTDSYSYPLRVEYDQPPPGFVGADGGLPFGASTCE